MAGFTNYQPMILLISNQPILHKSTAIFIDRKQIAKLRTSDNTNQTELIGARSALLILSVNILDISVRKSNELIKNRIL